MTLEERTTIRLIVIVVSMFLLWWQARWLLRAYRRERDRQPAERRSPRIMLAAQASVLFTALSMVFGIYTARRLALGAVAISTLVEVVRRRFIPRTLPRMSDAIEAPKTVNPRHAATRDT